MKTLAADRALPPITRRRPSAGGDGLLVAGSVVLALIAGLAVAVLPAPFIVVLALVPLVFGLSLAYPAVGLVFTLMVIFQIIPAQFHPRLPFGSGTLRVYDLMIVFLTALLFVKHLTLQRPLLSPMQPFLLPLLYLFACVAVSLVYVKLAAPNDRLLSEGRYFIAWMLLPLIVLGIDTERWFRRFWQAMLGLAVVMAVYVCIQTYGGVPILDSARDLSLSTTSAEASAGVIRSAVGGATHLIVLALFVCINRVMERRWRLLAAVPFALLMLAALGASFGRAVWVSTIAGLLVSAFVFRGLRAAVGAAVLIAVLVTALMGALVASGSATGQALVERVSRFGEEVDRGGSFQWRLQENRDARASIERHPLLGVGVGGDYKAVNRSHGVFAVETAYIHNAYLYFPVKMGLHATLIPLFFMAAMLVAVRRALRADPAADRARIAALAGTFSMMCVVSLNQPEWTAIGGIAAFCVVMGLMVLERRFGSAQQEPAPR